jgi:hypothetical protein
MFWSVADIYISLMWQFLSFAKEKIDYNKKYYIINPVLKSIGNFIFEISENGLEEKVSCVLSVFCNCFIKIFPKIKIKHFSHIYSVFEFLKDNLNLDLNQFLEKLKSELNNLYNEIID